MSIQHENLKYIWVNAKSDISVSEFGIASNNAHKLVAHNIKTPDFIAFPFASTRLLRDLDWYDFSSLVDGFDGDKLFSVQPSTTDPSWGGPSDFFDIGLNDEVHSVLTRRFGKTAADKRYLDHIVAYSCNIAHLDPEDFEDLDAEAEPHSAALAIYEEQIGKPFPQSPATQLFAVLKHMARVWESVSARLLRQANGAPPDAGLGLLVGDYSWTTRDSFKGLSQVGNLDAATGEWKTIGHFCRNSTDLSNEQSRIPIVSNEQEKTVEKLFPEEYALMTDVLDKCRHEFKDALDLEIALVDNGILITNVHRPNLSIKANLGAVVSLTEDGIISRKDALLRVDPKSLTELLHAKVDPRGDQPVLFSGVPASPGGATGCIVFSAAAAIQMAAKDTACILVRRETSPEDVRGLLAAKGIVTERGGATSHAAVIARGLGVPCIAGASNISVSSKERSLSLADGTVLREGDMITIDGSNGSAFAGNVRMREPSLDESFEKLMLWADEVRKLGVRANADTPDDAEMVQKFNADGIGLCRTEHMFFEPSRMIIIRELIFAENDTDRRLALDQLLPIQRSDFQKMYTVLEGKPICIRLFDPPLHEFLPTDRDGQIALAEALNLSVSHVVKRVDSLSEYNPMLGLRGVRLGITVPEIYDMQVRAIFEAAIAASHEIGSEIIPEIMIPLVSTKREVDIVKKRIDRIATDLSTVDGKLEYKLGVLLETPRAILRATDIAEHAQILSFGTNDLTQMTFGISRDDVGRFIGPYLDSGAFEVDPFTNLDMKGVGELMSIGVERGRAGRPDVTLTLCGEHAGEVDVIRFCEGLGFRYVSCSPYRVPVARLAAAQLALQKG